MQKSVYVSVLAFGNNITAFSSMLNVDLCNEDEPETTMAVIYRFLYLRLKLNLASLHHITGIHKHLPRPVLLGTQRWIVDVDFIAPPTGPAFLFECLYKDIL